MEALIELLLAQVGKKTDYSIHDMPRPNVITMSPKDLTLEYYSGASHRFPEKGVDDRLHALFSFEDCPCGTIDILAARYVDGSDDFDDPAEATKFRDFLPHELVHFAQWQSGTAVAWVCQNSGERKAYTLGDRYFCQVRADDPLPNRMF